MLLIANEFLDALPVHQLVATERGWVERLIDVTGGELALVPAERPSDLAGGLPASDHHLGQVVEVSPLRSAQRRDGTYSRSSSP